ncbi:MAG: ABC transporter permease [Clostridium sp.]|jgi:spermidine/putrescine transport system permease protein|nr:ABC transporter permease [Clostridium sp.]
MRYRFSRKHLCIPYAVFLTCFVIAPLIVIFYYAFTNGEGRFSLSNLTNFFTSSNTIGTLFYSILISVTTTCVCLLIAYPVAYILARSKIKKKAILLAIFIVPMWINFTLRIMALKEVLSMIEGNLAYHPFLNTIIGMTYDYLPFMILPLYTTLMKLDNQLLEAAYDLGASKIEVFTRVTLPLSLPGIVSGVTMVFLPAMTNYVILDMLYNNTFIMGSLIGSYFNAYDWHSGSMISIVLLLIIFIITWATKGFTEKEPEKEAIL